MNNAEIAAALQVWRDGLVQLTGMSRLIKFRPTKTGAVVIQEPDAAVVFAGVRGNGEWSFRGLQEDSDEAEAPTAGDGRILKVARAEKDLGPVLRTLMRKADTEFLDRGLHVLYLAVGMLHWADVDGTAMRSPLLLVPVMLESDGPRSTPRLRGAEEDIVVNPALVLRMQDFGVTIPTFEQLEDESLDGLFAAVSRAVQGLAGWEIRPEVVLSTFTFHKEAMYRDLIDNEAAIAAHPLVRALATKNPAEQTDAFAFDSIGASDIDRLAPPEDAPLVLDADSSQRAAIAAAVAGRSFVMDGPPGTGKSQTIANMIGALLEAGKTVLFVSEKAAALEVVRNRLADAGLDNFLLELHSHKARRKEVATALARALNTVAVPPLGVEPLTYAEAKRKRQQLNDYAEAMNVIREPLGFTLHHVLGLLSTAAHLPLAPAPETAPADLTQAEYQQIREVAARLERAWRPALQGESYLWRDVIDEASLEGRLYVAGAALDELETMTSINSQVLTAFGLTRPSDAEALIDLLDHQARRPAGIPPVWLTRPDWTGLTGMRDDLEDALHVIERAESATVAASGVSWDALPAPATLPPVPVAPADDGAVDPAPLTADVAEGCATRFEAQAAMLTRCQDAARGLAARLGINEVETFDQVDRALDLIDLGFAPERPILHWLRRDGLDDARRATADLHAAIAALTEAEAAAMPVFTDAVLTLPLQELHERFTTVHTGLRKLSGAYRRDRKTLAVTLLPGIKPVAGVANLGLARAWQDATNRLKETAAHHASALGRYWHGRETDFAAIDRALQIADRALNLAPNEAIDSVAAYLCGAEPLASFQTLSRQSREDLGAWRAGLTPSPALTARPEMLLHPLQAAVTWLTAHVTPLRQVAARTRAVDAVTGKRHTHAEAENLLVLRHAAATAHARLEARSADFAAAFGELYRAVRTDVGTIDDALAWTESARRVTGGPLTDPQAAALATIRPTRGLPEAWAKWTQARRRIVDAFAETRRGEIGEELNGYDTARDFMALLREDSAGQQEWFAYRQAGENLARRGLDTAIDFCIDRNVPAQDVPPVLERALLRAWADHIIATDARLQPDRYEDRAALVEAYRQVDRQLIVGATHRIVRAVNARRPSATGVGEPGIIRREGMKSRKLKPVRDLVAETRNASLAIKPCFMMSPLAVSQYLPPDMQFDVVIFDEASQVTPGDAINCIYRGRALVLAGDDKQLPPTSFFDRQIDEDADDETEVNDFQSILELAKACGAFRNLGLKWHYRSRHEDLIAFSNSRFYEGELITYPSAHSDGEDVGVAFFPVDGVYRRGTTADNPIEAAEVAKRVIEHFTHRPHMTLGVVAFSVAQVQAIEDALAKAREPRRDLDRFFDSTDRLSAFFVKSLESVQGDERDVMIMSIGYGPDEVGKISTNFGPLNKAKGWRRLNVAITRARYRIEIVSSLRAGSIPDSNNENVRYLQAYLDYAERGRSSLALDPSPSGMGPESPFEESVINTIRSWGYTVEPQVGAAGFRIDMAIRHPAHPGVYALGIECDGYQYHSAPSARDRDRLREQVLSGLGWRLHRIWGTSWYRNRPTEESRLKAAIETAIAAPVEGRLAAVPTDLPSRPVVTVEEIDHDAPPSWTSEYVTATVDPLPRGISPSSPDSPYKMVDAVEMLAQVEGPVHITVIHARLRSAWNIGQVGSKIRANIDLAIRLADLRRESDYIDVPDRPVSAVRRPGDGVARNVDQIHPDELALALVLLIQDAGPLPRPDLITATARIFGWHRTGRDISTALDVIIDLLIEDGVLEDNDGRIAAAKAAFPADAEVLGGATAGRYRTSRRHGRATDGVSALAVMVGLAAAARAGHGC